MNKKKLLVLSGINLFEGGPLSIYYDLLDSIIEQEIDKRFDVIAFVHTKKIFLKYKKSHITFIELPKSRKGYLFRFYYEYVFLEIGQEKEIYGFGFHYMILRQMYLHKIGLFIVIIQVYSTNQQYSITNMK